MVLGLVADVDVDSIGGIIHVDRILHLANDLFLTDQVLRLPRERFLTGCVCICSLSLFCSVSPLRNPTVLEIISLRRTQLLVSATSSMIAPPVAAMAPWPIYLKPWSLMSRTSCQVPAVWCSENLDWPLLLNNRKGTLYKWRLSWPKAAKLCSAQLFTIEVCSSGSLTFTPRQLNANHFSIQRFYFLFVSLDCELIYYLNMLLKKVCSQHLLTSISCKFIFTKM